MEKEEDQKSISDSDTSLEDDDNDDELLETQIFELKSKICDNPYDYNAYLQLIDLVRKSGDLIRLREARENMAAKFPLTPELWLQWIRDESGLATDEDQRNFVINLFDKATNDYVSPDIWLEYVQYSICLLGTTDGLKRIRSIFEEAVSAVGLDVQGGTLIWEAFREFEKSVVEITEEKQLSDQYARIFTLFKRQFSVPLIHMENKFDELKEWVSEMKDIVIN
ncbi:Squamous cell carcinoma antigen recognized by T-cells 3-like protein [Leptotrombidium deliense]|uniref:Squamous cell carcinoma antigen recognized by T-cells 3-like protein n=1 Tax=Leptotrombidium deliense TaxID=299467 RepID=A0A443RZ62_9ACAR|nr:Squamous cell carcinoma antigen recognized by T-cells 3-like protein [Leptotrombidium deliense]